MGFVASTRFCRESGFVANTRFFGLVLSRLLLRHKGFYSDFVQISAQKIGGWDLCHRPWAGRGSCQWQAQKQCILRPTHPHLKVLNFSPHENFLVLPILTHVLPRSTEGTTNDPYLDHNPSNQPQLPEHDIAESQSPQKTSHWSSMLLPGLQS